MPTVLRSAGIAFNAAESATDLYPPLPKSASWVAYTSLTSVVDIVPVILIGIIMTP
jgi:hypothetical protein